MRKLLQQLVPVILVLAACSTSAMAADTDMDARLVGYPTGYGLEAPSTSAAWFLLVGLGLVALGPLFLNAHRTHLD